jgi:hypothetical protein
MNFRTTEAAILVVSVALVVSGCRSHEPSSPQAATEQKQRVITRESDNPFIWRGVHQALEEAGIQRRVFKMESLDQYQLMTVLVTFEDGKTPTFRTPAVFVYYDGGRWKVRGR